MTTYKTSDKITLSVRLAKPLWQKLNRNASALGVDKTAFVTKCLEKELSELAVEENTILERLETLQEKLKSPSDAVLPWSILEKLILTSSFCEALLQKLHIQQAGGEWSKIVGQARAQAVAETNYLKEKIYGMAE